jgi:S1-C subfamily serine protease
MKIFAVLLAICTSFAVSAQTPRDVSRDMNFLSEHMSKYAVKVYAVQNPEKPESMGTGSGELVRSTDGVVRILTNHHVVGPLAETVYVQFDGAPFAQKVRVIGRDPLVDLALLEAPSPLPDRVRPIAIANAARSPLAIGNLVYAVGYPSGGRNISYGVINSTTSPHEESGVGIYFTHQAPISPGSSGGLLVRFNASGEPELVGINTQVAVQRNGMVTNMGFSIKPEVIERMIAKLENGQVFHAHAGLVVAGTEHANPYAYELGTKRPYPPPRPGIMVVHVAPNSPAHRAGLGRGDMIRKLEVQQGERWVNIPIPSAASLNDSLFFELAPGTTVRFGTTRGTQELTRTLVLERFPQSERSKTGE